MEPVLPSKRPKRLPPTLNLASTLPILSPEHQLTLKEPQSAAPILSQQPKPRSLRNLKKLSLSIPPSAAPTTSPNQSATSLAQPDVLSPTIEKSHYQPFLAVPQRSSQPIRRASIISLPAATTSTGAGLHRRDEDDSPTAPYLSGPIEVMPRVWIGTEDNAKDWKGLKERGIKSILNVAKELSAPFENIAGSLRSTHSASDLNDSHRPYSGSTYYPPSLQSGRSGFHYLKLPWSHGQANLVKEGFPAAMAFVDEAHERKEGVLIHCQCGVSRSATLVIALLMRGAAVSLDDAPSDIKALKGGGMHAAYAYVKEKSKWIGPNMSLIYQLLDYERTLNSSNGSPASSLRSLHIDDQEADWGRQRQAMADAEAEGDAEPDSADFMVNHEAKALDQEMEERNVARQTSFTSANSSTSGTGVAWKSRFGFSSVNRTRAGSTGSNITGSSIISEDPLEDEDEEGVLGGPCRRSPSTIATDEEVHAWNEDSLAGKETPRQSNTLQSLVALMDPPPSASPFKSTFNIPPKPPGKPKPKHRPPPLVGVLPTVPSSPLHPVAPIHDTPPNHSATELPLLAAPPRTRQRIETRNPEPPPPSIRSRRSRETRSSFSSTSSTRSTIPTPSQTLFVFPPEPSGTSTSMMLIDTPSTDAFLMLPTPRVSNSIKNGRRRSFIGLGTGPAPTTAFSLVEARGAISDVKPL